MDSLICSKLPDVNQELLPVEEPKTKACGFILRGRLSVCSRRTLAASPSVWEEVADGFLIWDVKRRSAGWEAGAWAQFKRVAPSAVGVKRPNAQNNGRRVNLRKAGVTEQILDRHKFARISPEPRERFQEELDRLDGHVVGCGFKPVLNLSDVDLITRPTI